VIFLFSTLLNSDTLTVEYINCATFFFSSWFNSKFSTYFRSRVEVFDYIQERTVLPRWNNCNKIHQSAYLCLAIANRQYGNIKKMSTFEWMATDENVQIHKWLDTKKSRYKNSRRKICGRTQKWPRGKILN